MSVTVYHNPHCFKSRNTLELLRDHGLKPEIVSYLETPPDPETLAERARIGRPPEAVLEIVTES